MEKTIVNPYLELGEVLPALLELVSINNKKEIESFKIYFKDEKTKNLKLYDKTRNLCFYLLTSYFKNYRPDLNNIDLYRVILNIDGLNIYYRDKDIYSSIGFTINSLIEHESYINNLSDKQYEDYYINQLIDILQ